MSKSVFGVMNNFQERPSRIWVENVRPQVEAGKYPIKRTPGESVEVRADIFVDGHDFLRAAIHYKRISEDTWHEAPMVPGYNDNWVGVFDIGELDDYLYRVVAWIDSWAGWLDGLRKKASVHQDVSLELLEGAQWMLDTASRAPATEAVPLLKVADLLTSSANIDEKLAAVGDPEVNQLMVAHQFRRDFGVDANVYQVQVDRERARFGSWYEMFPRSFLQSGQYADELANKRSGTFKQAIKQLDYIADLGFDVVYLPPIHPIGSTKRKGRNNSLVCQPDDPGSPWAVGGDAGGHDSIEPTLGSEADFLEFVAQARNLGLEIALDLALQCSPDHPYVSSHPEWFRHRPDGTIHYAENPPKKYQDIYPFNFECAQWESLWQEIRRVVFVWIERGVRIFRVDNPHTKPFAFWEWLLGDVREQYPDVLFLSEAFTRPKLMYALAKLGFHQSYTYFTWRNSQQELTEYLTELTTTEPREYFRPNFFANTPDILHAFLQQGGRAAFQLRAVLAATLSGNYGIYCGFEFCENEAVPGSEEYLNSEKYEIKYRDANAPQNIKQLLKSLNQIRRENLALQFTNNLRFLEVNNAKLLGYLKRTESDDNIIICCVNLDPQQTQEGMLRVPTEVLGLPEQYMVHDLISGERYQWRGEWNYVRLDPARGPAHIFKVEEWER